MAVPVLLIFVLFCTVFVLFCTDWSVCQQLWLSSLAVLTDSFLCSAREFSHVLSCYNARWASLVRCGRSSSSNWMGLSPFCGTFGIRTVRFYGYVYTAGLNAQFQSMFKCGWSADCNVNSSCSWSDPHAKCNISEAKHRTVFTEANIAAVEASCYSLLLKTARGDNWQICERVMFKRRRQKRRQKMNILMVPLCGSIAAKSNGHAWTFILKFCRKQICYSNSLLHWSDTPNIN